MNKLLIYYLPILIWSFSCKESGKERSTIKSPISNGELKESKNSLIHADSLIKQSDKDGHYAVTISDHKIKYSDSLSFNEPNWSIEWMKDEVKNADSVFTYKTDPIHHQTIRVLKSGRDKILVRGVTEITIPEKIGHIDEIIKHLLIFRKYVGNNYEGTITKYICGIDNQSINIYDSISAGEYGEGWGATERIVSHSGEPLGGIIYQDDKYYWDSENLVVLKVDNKSNGHVFLINGTSRDTVVNFDIDLQDIRFLRYAEDNLIFYNNEQSRLNYLHLFNSTGKREWKVAASTFSEILVSLNNKLIVATGYSFPGKPDKNTHNYFTIAYDTRNGDRLWDFPTALAFDKNFKPNDQIVTSNLFQITTDAFGLIVGKWANYGPDGYRVTSNNKLIIFDDSGRINFIINLSDSPERYTFNKINNNRFELIGYQENWSFNIKKPHNKTYE